MSRSPMYKANVPRAVRRFYMRKRIAFLLVVAIMVALVGSVLGRDFAVFASGPEPEVTVTATVNYSSRHGLTEALMNSQVAPESAAEPAAPIRAEQPLQDAPGTELPISPAPQPRTE